MDQHDFDRAVIAAVFVRAGLVGWRETTLVEAARDAGLELSRVRERFSGKTAVLLRFGVEADRAVLAAAPTEGLPREKLFDLLMSRFDQLQQHRGGILALMQSLRTDPGTAAMLWGGTLRSMRWLLDAAGVPSGGVVGALRVHGLAAVWAYALRAWETDEGADLPSTMAAVDRGLDRAVQAEGMLPGSRPSTSAEFSPDLPPEMGPDLGSEPTILSGAVIVASEDGPAVL